MATDGPLPFGDLLRRLRLAAGLSQEALAERAGLSARGISDLERGARLAPRADTIRLLADGLGLDPPGRAALAAAARPRRSGAEGGAAVAAAGLPRGAVALLFAERLGSGGAFGSADPAAPAGGDPADDPIGAAVAAHGGNLYAGGDDHAEAAFPDAGAAVAAAVAAQRTLLDRRGAGDGASPNAAVRIALHVAEVEPAGGGYRSPAVGRLWRVLAAAHAGQILATDPVRQAVEEPPPGAGFVDLGAFRLPGHPAPERLHQVVHPALPATFPPPHGAIGGAAPLPAPPTALIGRDTEVAAAVDLLRRPGVRLLTLIGPGGVGKTRLAIAVAAAAAPHVAEAATFVELAPVADPSLVAPTVAAALNARETGGLPVREAVAAALRDRRHLLVLDNFEHLLEAAPLVADLLAACPGLTVVVASQSPLRIRGEHVVPVGPLPLPDAPDPAARPDADGVAAVEANPAVRLFVERAQAVWPGFVLDAGNAAAVAAICRQMDGLPLAIELAAGWTRVLPPQGILARLTDRPLALAGGPRDLPPRHQTIRAALDWSHDLLSPAGRTLLRRLAVFAGGWTPETAAAALAAAGVAPPGEADAAEGIAELVDRSLAQREDRPPGRGPDLGVPRFRLPAIVRLFALERLREAGEEPALRAAHARVFLDLAVRGDAGLTGRDQATWAARMDAERDNFREALVWSLDGPDSGAGAEAGEAATGDGPDAPADLDTALRLCGALWRFWDRLGYLREGRTWVGRVLARGGDPDSLPRADALMGLANLSVQDSAQARDLYREALTVYRRRGEEAGAARALTGLGLVAVDQGRYEDARRHFEEAGERWNRLGNAQGAMRVRHHLGHLASVTGDQEEAERRFEGVLRESLDVGDQEGVAYATLDLGRIARRRAQVDRAEALLERAHSLLGQSLDGHGVAYTNLERGMLALDRGDIVEATRRTRLALSEFHELGDAFGIVAGLEGVVAVALVSGDALPATRLLGAVDAWRTRTGVVSLPVDEAARVWALNRAQSLLGDAFEIEWRRGQAMEPNDAILSILG